MSTLQCLSCTAETTNGLVLCDRCQINATVKLEFIPVYFRNLARWRPGRAGGRPVPGSRMPTGLGQVAPDDRVSRALDAAGNDITTWARSLADDRGIELPDAADEAETVSALCRLFAQNLTSIATLEWAGEFVTELAEHEKTLRWLTEEVVPGWYAGGCVHCGSGTYVVPGLTWVKCSCCDAITYARDHLETVLTEARDWVARPMRVAEAVVALVDTEQSVPKLHKRISKWGERGPDNGGIVTYRSLDRDGDEVGPKKFRLGDVLDKLKSEGATRINEEVTAEAS